MGRTVGGYELIRRLGSGGSGTVWEARDGAGHVYALKLLHPAVASSEESRKRLLREAWLVNSIPGDGVARVIDFEADAAEPFMVTELIDGPTLDQVVAEEPLSLEEAHFLGIQLQDILRRVHRAGVVHRDLKPANVILSDSGPVLIDFGIADGDASEKVTKTGVVNGTPGYVAPELLNSANRPSFGLWRVGDWWAWSALLLSAMTGRAPFGRGDIQGVLDRVFRGQPDVADLDPGVAQVMRMALAPSGADRWTPDQVLWGLKAPETIPILPNNSAAPHSLAPPPRPSARPTHTPGEAEIARPRARAVPQVAVALFGLIALLPAYFGGWGLLGPAALLLLLVTVGESTAWADRSLFIRLIATPVNMLAGLLKTLPGAALAAAVMGALWLAFRPAASPFLVWAASWVALIAIYLAPTSAPLRAGTTSLFGRSNPVITWALPAVVFAGLGIYAALQLESLSVWVK